jgi:hypothetical protein
MVLLPGCAALAPRIEGTTDIVAWQATDLSLERRATGWYYTFNLLVREVRGTDLTFNEIETIIYQPGINPYKARYRGEWRLEAKDQFRIPLLATMSCHQVVPNCTGTNVPIPLWRITMSGTDGHGEPVKTVIDLTLPADPPSPPQTSSKEVRAIALTPPRGSR